MEVSHVAGNENCAALKHDCGDAHVHLAYFYLGFFELLAAMNSGFIKIDNLNSCEKTNCLGKAPIGPR